MLDNDRDKGDKCRLAGLHNEIQSQMNISLPAHCALRWDYRDADLLHQNQVNTSAVNDKAFIFQQNHPEQPRYLTSSYLIYNSSFNMCILVSSRRNVEYLSKIKLYSRIDFNFLQGQLIRNDNPLVLQNFFIPPTGWGVVGRVTRRMLETYYLDLVSR